MPDTTQIASPRYDEDFYAWALHQAALLRELRDWRPNVPLDLENLIEEVEGLAGTLKRSARSQVRRILEHFLKLQFSPSGDPRRIWSDTIGDARMELEELLTATLEPEIADELSTIYARARRQAARDLERYGESAASSSLPQACPYTWEQVRDEDWYPTPPA